jgi:hypothetical protein
MLVLSVIMPNVFCAECHNLVYCAQCHYAECRYAECPYVECRGAHSQVAPFKQLLALPSNVRQGRQ